MSDPQLPKKRPVFFIKRLRRGATGTNTLNEHSQKFLCCVADIELDTFSEEEAGKPGEFFPPLAETD